MLWNSQSEEVETGGRFDVALNKAHFEDGRSSFSFLGTFAAFFFF